jgi:hypothetical protein
MKHRSLDFDVEEAAAHKWRWKIYPKIEDAPKIIGRELFDSRTSAIDGCLTEIVRIELAILALRHRWRPLAASQFGVLAARCTEARGFPRGDPWEEPARTMMRILAKRSLTVLTSLCTTASERLLRNGLQNQMPLFL